MIYSKYNGLIVHAKHGVVSRPIHKVKPTSHIRIPGFVVQARDGLIVRDNSALIRDQETEPGVIAAPVKTVYISKCAAVNTMKTSKKKTTPVKRPKNKPCV